MKTMDNLVTEVDGLVVATNELLNSITDSKGEIDTLINEAKVDAATIKGNAAIVDAKVKEAEANANKAKISADNAKASELRAQEVSELATVADAIKLAVKSGRVPIPDFYLPLHNSLDIKIGKGTPKQVDVSQAQDGTLMVDLPEYKADFTRASKATYINREGKLVEAAIDEPRFEKDGILIEGASTNLYLRDSYVMGGTDGNNLSERIIKNFGIDVTINKLTATRTVWALYGYSFIPNNVITQDTVSIIFVYKKDINIRMIRDTITTRKSITPGFTVTNGLPDQPLEEQTIQSFREIDGYVFVNLTIPLLTKDFIAMVAHYHNTVEEGYVCEMGIIQIEELPFASSYIPTNGTPVTRAGELLSTRHIESDKSITVYIDTLLNKYNGSTQRYLLYGHGTFLHLRYNTMDSIFTSINFYRQEPGAGNHVRLTGKHMGVGGIFDYANNKQSAFCDGEVDVFVPLAAPAPPIVEGNIINIGSYYGLSRQINGHIRNLKIWNQALTPEQVANI